jgi:predicted transcriptional regulator
MSKNLQTITNERDVKAVVLMLRAIASETRLCILRTLSKSPKTWTELIFELRANPKVLRDNLNYLRDSNLVQKREPVGFELTEAGCALMELSLTEILEVDKKK